MNRLVVVIWLAVVVLVAVVTGCDRAPRYDSRLVAADSLMQPAPDSALALVEAVAPGSLKAKGDRAYRDLLLTQARYRCYITATSDSDINRALDFYRQHDGEREKLTRTLIYKGAVMEELGHPDSAMHYYKQAEATADDHDYANLGQINTRIADLYRRYYADEDIGFEKYKQALHYYELTGNKPMQQNSLYNLALFASISGRDSFQALLSQSMRLALELNDSSRIYDCKELLCRVYLTDETHFGDAKLIALECLNDYEQFVNVDLILDLANIYATENNTDSASYFLDFLNDTSIFFTAQQQARKYSLRSMIAQANGDTNLSKTCAVYSNSISDSITCNRNKYQIQRIENVNASQQASRKIHHIYSLQSMIVLLLLAFVFIVLLAAFYHYRRINRIKAIIRELKNASVNKHEALLDRLDAKDVVIDQFVRNMVDFVQASIKTSEQDSPSVIRKRIQNSVGKMADNEEFWNALRHHLDRNYDNLISKFAENPRIDENELRLIELSCCGFNYVEIAITMGYNPNYISTKRKTIARKLGIWIPLQDYLDKLIADHSTQ